MRNTLIFSLAIIIFSAFAGLSCKKKSSQLPEENLRISIDAPPYSEIPGPGFDFNLVVESVMPAAGVKIVSVVQVEANNQIISLGPDSETTNKISKISINNLPRQKICICTITVTSKRRSTNTATINFRVVYK